MLALNTRAGIAAAPDLARLHTVADLYDERLRVGPEDVACRHFEARTQSWQETRWSDLAILARRYAEGLRRSRLAPGERVAIQLVNGPDWLAIDWATARLGLVSVSLFADDSPAGAAQILRDCGARVLFLRDAAAWRALSSYGLPQLREVVSLRGQTAAPEPHLRSLARWLPPPADFGAAAAQADRLASIVYTSGSTGSPRGVMLSHRNLVSNVLATQQAVPLESADTVLSALPLAHLFGRSVGVYLGLAAGATLIFGRGSASLTEDLASQRPSVMIGVPRVYERIYGALRQELDEGSASRRALFRLAVETGWAAQDREAGPLKLRLLPTGLARRAGNLLRERFGGRLRLAVSGGAGLSPEIARVFVALGIPLLRGYGLTEAGPVVSVNRLDDNDCASEGRPLPGVETRKEADGELWVRGPSVMMGYWNDAAGTAAVLDAAGWLRTGDRVSRLETERLYLVGRLKEILVTATGEKASPTAIEASLQEIPLVEQVMVVGEARPYLAALIVPQPGALALLRARIGLIEGDDSDAARELLEQMVLEECQRRLQTAPRNHWIVRVALVFQPWTPHSGCLTGTHKLRRCEIARRHETEIERLYAGHYTVAPTDCSRNAGL